VQIIRRHIEMPAKRKRKQAAAANGHGLCTVCDANVIEPASDFCSTCSVLECSDLFQSLDNDTSYTSACCSAEVPDEQAECLKRFALKEHELDELRRAVADVGLADALRDRQGDPEFQKVLAKLLSCRLSLTTRVALSVRNAQDFVNNVLEHVLTAAEKKQLEGFDVEVVDMNTSICLTTNTPDATRVHMCKHDMIKGYRLKLHRVQKFHDKGFQDSSTTGYLLRVMAILQYELALEKKDRPYQSYFATLRHSAQNKKRTQLEYFVQQLASPPTPAQKKSKADEKAKAAAARKSKAAEKKAKEAEKKSKETAAEKAQAAEKKANEAATAQGGDGNGVTIAGAKGPEDDAATSASALVVGPSVSKASSAHRDLAAIIGAAMHRDFSNTFRDCAAQTAGVDRFYKDCDASKSQPFTKLLVVRHVDQRYRDFYVAPEVFTSLEFSNEQIMQLVVNGKRRALPHHLSCIIAKEDAYGPLLFHIAVRCHAFSRLQTLALLVPTTTNNDK
jgi:hypothetical protein